MRLLFEKKGSLDAAQKGSLDAMKKRAARQLAALALVFLVVAMAASGCANSRLDDIDWEFFNERAERFATELAGGDFDEAALMLDEAMTQLVGSLGLQSLWADVLARAGGYVGVHETANEEIDGYYLSVITLVHENSGVSLRVVFSDDGLIAGLFVEGYPVIPGAAYVVTEPVARDGFTDYPITVGEGSEFPLSGILSMPDSAAQGRVPAAVIVHGSGAQDMDGTLFGNKPLRDVAEYLAANGIAVIRYNKRPFVDASWTVWEETIEDAILATEILRADPRIDEGRVFIIGHSLGGMLAPRIHAEGGDFAGLVLLAGSPRFLLDVSKDQNIAFINEAMEGEARDAALAQVEELWDDQIYELLGLPDDIAKDTPVEGGVSVYYFKDLYNHPMSAFIDGVTVPILVLQGSKDMQILADVDFALLQEMLADRPNVDFKLYEGLNHLFMPSTNGTMMGLMDEYAIEGHVDSQVLADIVVWIHGN